MLYLVLIDRPGSPGDDPEGRCAEPPGLEESYPSRGLSKKERQTQLRAPLKELGSFSFSLFFFKGVNKKIRLDWDDLFPCRFSLGRFSKAYQELRSPLCL